MTKNLNSVIEQMEDVTIMLEIRENGIKGAFNIVRNLPEKQVMRLQSMYWACDYMDLHDLKVKLERRFLELTNISELTNLLQTK